MGRPIPSAGKSDADASVGCELTCKHGSEAMFADSSAVLDQPAAAIFLVDQQGRITYFNTSARTLLSAAVVVQNSDGSLSAIDRIADRRLRKLYSDIPANERAFPSGGPAALALPGARNDDAHVAYVSPLGNGHRRNGGVNPSLAVVVISEGMNGLTGALGAVARTYNLTQAEARLLATIIGIGRVAQVARALGTCETAAKSHLQRIFEKTGTHRQADLVKLAASFMSPFCARPWAIPPGRSP